MKQLLAGVAMAVAVLTLGAPVRAQTSPAMPGPSGIPSHPALLPKHMHYNPHHRYERGMRAPLHAPGDVADELNREELSQLR
jgi:hypothetical protein